jgi:Domain of unknown function (DUF4173)
VLADTSPTLSPYAERVPREKVAENEAHLSARVLASCAAIGALAAWALPGHPLGAGVPVIAALAVAAAALDIPRARRTEAAGFAALGLVLTGTATLRSAPWVVAISLVLSLGLASLSAAGGKTWNGLLAGTTELFRRVPESARLLVLSIGLGALLLVPFTVLFATADQAFARLAADAIVPGWDVGLIPLRLVTFALAAVLVSGLAIVASRPRGFTRGPWRRPPKATPEGVRAGGVEWAIAIGILDLLFAGFVLVQIAVLFGGHGRVLQTSGLTYAEYARSGFVQLMVAAILTLSVVAFVFWWSGGAKKQTPMLRVLLATLCGLTIVILFAAIRRLGLYEEAFGFTHARLLAHVFMLWVGGTFAFIVAGVFAGTTWLPRALVVWTTVVTVASTIVVNPDGFIAARNVDRFQRTGELDVRYVSTLSADAIPALATLPPGIRACALGPIAARLSRDESLVGWNLARERARDVLATLDGAGFCPE